MRCQEVRRRLVAVSSSEDMKNCGADMRLHLAACPACLQHAEAQLELTRSLRGASAAVDTDGAHLSAVRSLVESRVAQITTEHKWSLIMSRFTHSIRRPVYMIPSVVAIVALLALTLFPWRVDNSGGYLVAFAGVDKDLALHNYGVQRVLQRLGITGADVEVGDCEASCNLTIRDLRDEKEVGKVVSVMCQLSDCQLLEVAREDDASPNISLNIPGKKEFTFEADGNVRCDFTQQLSAEDLEQIEVVVHEVQFGEGGMAACVGDSGGSIYLVKIGNCQTPCVLAPECINGLPTGIVSADSITLTFDVGCGSKTGGAGENEFYFDDSPAGADPAALSKQESSSGPIHGYQLNQNYPNPFNAGTTISFNVADDGGQVTLAIFNVQGQLVKTLVDRHLAAGPHEITWDGTDTRGSAVASGVYLYRLTAGEYIETKKMSLIK